MTSRDVAPLALHMAHAIDHELTAKAYIVPGLGDAGIWPLGRS
ncbi:MAG: hypothetical protein R3B47_20665 [Bacteroidia bacterium]